MPGLINLRDLFSLQAVNNEEYTNQLMELNNVSAENGLVLTREQASELIETRTQSLRDTGRVEIGVGALKLLIETFSASSYLDAENYADTLNELLELFYYMKTESHDRISDRELVERMFDMFEHECAGSIELMQNANPLYRKKHPVYDFSYEEDENTDDGGDSDDYSYLYGEHYD